MTIPTVLPKVCFVAQKLRGRPSAFSEPLEANGTEEVPGREGPRDLTGFTSPLCSHQAAPLQPLVISCMAPLAHLTPPVCPSGQAPALSLYNPQSAQNTISWPLAPPPLTYWDLLESKRSPHSSLYPAEPVRQNLHLPKGHHQEEEGVESLLSSHLHLRSKTEWDESNKDF